MASKKRLKQNTQSKPEAVTSNASQEPTQQRMQGWLCDFRVQATIVAILAFVFYFNTFSNDLAMDDTLIISYNEYVYEGFAGIPAILSCDAYYSYDQHMGVGNQLSGGRYRPLSIVNFAIEQQFFGAVPQQGVDSVIRKVNLPGPEHDALIRAAHARHVFNVLWYALSVVVLLYFLRYVVFKANPIMAFLAAIIFTVHPIHTEVVANIKSRDEILSLLFICLTFICAFKYREQQKAGFLIAGLMSYFLALLSKEYGITLVVLLPVAFYIFDRASLSKSIVAALPYAGVAALFLIIRSKAVGFSGDVSSLDILNNPYAFATDTERMATIIATPLHYLQLLIFPHPLTSDYSYNTIPYKDFASLAVWLSLAIHGALLWLLFVYAKRRHVLAFAIAFYLLNLLLVCNVLFNIGATMSERLIYHSSVGFAIAIGYLLYKGMEIIKPIQLAKPALAGSMILLIVLCGAKIMARNKDWKSNYTLFPADLKTSPNSVMLNAYVGAALVDQSADEKDTAAKQEELHNAVRLFNKAISLDTDYVVAYANRACAYYSLAQPDSSYSDLVKAKSLLANYSQLPQLFYNNAVLYMSKQQYPRAVNSLQISLQLDPNYTLSKNVLHQIISSGVLK